MTHDNNVYSVETWEETNNIVTKQFATQTSNDRGAMVAHWWIKQKRYAKISNRNNNGKKYINLC